MNTVLVEPFGYSKTLTTVLEVCKRARAENPYSDIVMLGNVLNGNPIKDEIKKLVLNGKSDKEIGNIFGLSYLTIKKYRQELGFIQKSSRPNKYKYNDIQFQIIIGSILGDASLVKMYKNGGTVFKVTHCLKQQDYLK